MPALEKKSAFIPVASAKPTGLADLGIPGEPVVKKGKLAEFTQPQDGGKVGRMFQNIRAVLASTTEGGQPSGKLVVLFEIFGDDNVPTGVNRGVDVALYAGDTLLAEYKHGAVFLPYACAWYENKIFFDIPLDVFEKADKLEFIALADEVRAF
ncbi:hypothetical protein [Derxia gummosa]|uniref:Uncharacterized protein n=1 Tax=Derxia gummosa DSM 723 TaxID=1121388 RepID=A0A8B6X1G2_9BURK|nr:hypothetical protein [Derxia gummosa]